jgi:uncharacterized protein
MARGVAGSIQRIMQSFLPREEDFFTLFAEMAAKAHQAAGLLTRLFAAYPDCQELVSAIDALEDDVDDLRHDCVRRLHETFVTPIMFDRQDIFDLADILDDVVDFTKAAADRTLLYQVTGIPPAVHELARCLEEATALLADACGRLEDLRADAAEFVQRVNAIENHADNTLKQGLAELFRSETNAVEVIKWKEIYDYLEEAIDHCEDTVNLIESALVRNS